MSTITLEATARETVGKSANRRLRFQDKIPAVIYGGDKDPQSITLSHNKVMIAFKNEAIYSSVLDLKIGDSQEKVILKDLQRHPFKPIILHMDLQRVSAKDVLVKEVPLHFLNEETAKGVKAGGIISHAMNQVEVKCQVKDLPPFIEVDLLKVNLDEVLHLSDLKLPKGVELTVDLSDEIHNLPVASIHTPKAQPIEEEEAVESSEDKESKEADAEEGTS